MNLVSRYEKTLTKPKTLVRQKLVTKKFGCSQVLIPLGIIHKQKTTTLSSTTKRRRY